MHPSTYISVRHFMVLLNLLDSRKLRTCDVYVLYTVILILYAAIVVCSMVAKSQWCGGTLNALYSLSFLQKAEDMES